MVAEIHPDDFAEFVDLEDQFIGIFGQFGLVLRHRFRDTDRATEVQVIDVPGEAALDLPDGEARPDREDGQEEEPPNTHRIHLRTHIAAHRLASTTRG